MDAQMPIEYTTARMGTSKWVYAARMSPGIRAKGYEVVITPKMAAKLQAEWEITTYGARLESLLKAAPIMFATLQKLLVDAAQQSEGRRCMRPNDRELLIISAVCEIDTGG